MIADDNGLDPSMWGNVQVDRRHYFSERYLNETRFLGLHAQLHACIGVENAKTILEIGVGPSLLEAILRHFNYEVVTFDFASDLKPTIVGRLPRLPFKNDSFDLVCAFEVLEHIPFTMLEDCFRLMRRIAKNKVIISVPSQAELDAGKLGVTFTIGRKDIEVDFWRRKRRGLTNPTEHYWELECNGVTAALIIKMAQAQGLVHIHDYLVLPYFHFFIFCT